MCLTKEELDYDGKMIEKCPARRNARLYRTAEEASAVCTCGYHHLESP